MSAPHGKRRPAANPDGADNSRKDTSSVTPDALFEAHIGAYGQVAFDSPPSAFERAVPPPLERTVGIRDAKDGAFGAWTSLGRKDVRLYANTGRPFTSDDLAEGLPTPPSPNAVGALIRKAAAEGWIHQVGWTTSSRPTAHGRAIRVWQGGPRRRGGLDG